MNKLSEILLCVIVLLAIVLGFLWHYRCVNHSTEAPVVPVPESAQVSPKTEVPKDVKEPVISATAKALIEAGNVCGAAVCQSEMSQALMEMAHQHAKYQAEHRAINHQNFNQRSEALRKSLDGYKFAEIVATCGGPRATNQIPEEAQEKSAASNLFASWKKSRRHWPLASKKHDFFGADMQRGSNGCWYGCIIVADKDTMRGTWKVSIEENGVAEAATR